MFPGNIWWGLHEKKTWVCKEFTILFFGQGVLTVRQGKLGTSSGHGTHEFGTAQYILEGYLSTFSAKLQKLTGSCWICC